MADGLAVSHHAMSFTCAAIHDQTFNRCNCDEMLRTNKSKKIAAKKLKNVTISKMLLKWGGQHFLLRFAGATLSLRLLHVDGDSKAVNLLEFAQLQVKVEGLEPLPPDARLVAAKEVENEELGMCVACQQLACLLTINVNDIGV